MRVHADLSFNCDVLSWDQSFQNAAFVRQGLDSQIQLSVGFGGVFCAKKWMINSSIWVEQLHGEIYF